MYRPGRRSCPPPKMPRSWRNKSKKARRPHVGLAIANRSNRMHSVDYPSVLIAKFKDLNLA